MIGRGALLMTPIALASMLGLELDRIFSTWSILPVASVAALPVPTLAFVFVVSIRDDLSAVVEPHKCGLPAAVASFRLLAIAGWPIAGNLASRCLVRHLRRR